MSQSAELVLIHNYGQLSVIIDRRSLARGSVRCCHVGALHLLTSIIAVSQGNLTRLSDSPVLPAKLITAVSLTYRAGHCGASNSGRWALQLPPYACMHVLTFVPCCVL